MDSRPTSPAQPSTSVVVAVAGAQTTQREADRAVLVVVPKVGLIPQRELQNPDHRIQVVVAVAAPTSI